jgi:hypothetical protein
LRGSVSCRREGNAMPCVGNLTLRNLSPCKRNIIGVGGFVPRAVFWKIKTQRFGNCTGRALLSRSIILLLSVLIYVRGWVNLGPSAAGR